jgi:cytidyltransferase-like protein
MNKNNKYNIGLIHGVFDVLHVGHIEHFKKAKEICKTLVASVTIDKHINKGPNRPAFSLNERIKVLKSIKYIDKVIKSNKETAVSNINKIKPDVYIKGLDYKNANKNSKNNLNLEINEIKKIGGIFYVTNSKLYSSSKILNEQYDYLNTDIRKFINQLDKVLLLKKLKNFFYNSELILSNKKHKILLTGEPIIDLYTHVKVQGKSQKSNIISTIKLKTIKEGGGTILVANFLTEFLNELTYFVLSNKKTIKILNSFNKKGKYLKFVNVNSDNEKIIIKERFIDNYSKTRLFQVNQNEKFFNDSKTEKTFNQKLVKETLNYENIIIFDYGYNYSNKILIKSLEKKSNKFFINCQTNSSNYGFNLFSKYKKAEIMCIDEMEFRLTIRDKNQNIEKLIKKNISLLKGYKIFIVTSGSKGCYILYNKKIHFIPTVFETTSDTTGCGDIFFSCFILFYLSKQFDLNETSLFSHIAAGLHGLNKQKNKNFTKDNFFSTAQTILK